MKLLSTLGICFVLATAVAFAEPDLLLVPVAMGPDECPSGDSIVIEEVLSTSPHFYLGDRVVVRGHYTLVSRDRAKLDLALTRLATGSFEPVSPDANIEVSKGSGKFELTYKVSKIGCLRVTLASIARNRSFGTEYFGTDDQLRSVGRSPRGPNTSQARGAPYREEVRLP